MKKAFINQFKRVLSAVVLTTFSLTSVQPSFLIAAPEVPLNVLQPQMLDRLPENLGSLKQLKVSGGEAPFVIHIQDAHANPDAQTKIAAMLQWIHEQQKGKTLLIGLEGAAGELHPEYLDFSKNYPALNDAIVSDLHQKGELTGAELFAWQLYKSKKSESVKFFGIETPELYRQNFEDYQNILRHKDGIEKALKPLRSDLEVLKSRLLSSELQSFFREKSRRKEGKFGSGAETPQPAQMDVYLKHLASLASKYRGIDLTDSIEQLRFPNYARLLVIERLQKGYNHSAAQIEELKALNLLKAASKTAQEQSIIEQLAHLETLRQPRPVVESVWRLAQQHSIDLAPFSSYIKKLGLTILKSEIETDGLFEEVDRLESMIVEKMIKKDTERLAVQILRDFSLTEKLVQLELTRPEFAQIKSRIAALNPVMLEARLNDMLKRKNASSFDLKFFDEAIRFYEGAESRDQALVENLFRENSENAVYVLITGGFHSAGMLQLLEEQGTGYAVIQPKISQFYPGLSEKVFSDQNSDLSKILKQNVLNVQESLFLKALLETGLPYLANSGAAQNVNESAAEMINQHPLLSKKIRASAKENVEFEISQALRPMAEFPDALQPQKDAIVKALALNGSADMDLLRGVLVPTEPWPGLIAELGDHGVIVRSESRPQQPASDESYNEKSNFVIAFLAAYLGAESVDVSDYAGLLEIYVQDAVLAEIIDIVFEHLRTGDPDFAALFQDVNFFENAQLNETAKTRLAGLRERLDIEVVRKTLEDYLDAHGAARTALWKKIESFSPESREFLDAFIDGLRAGDEQVLSVFPRGLNPDSRRHLEGLRQRLTETPMSIDDAYVRPLEDLIDPSVLSSEQRNAYSLLVDLGQGHLFNPWSPAGKDVEAKRAFFDEVIHYNRTNPHGNLTDYVTAGKKLLENAKTGDDPLKTAKFEHAFTTQLTVQSEEYAALEQEGLAHANKLGFILVAGGVGDRLKQDWSQGLPKVQIPLSLLRGQVHLEKDIRTIHALVEKSNRINGEDRTGQLFIMTSDETQQGTQKLLTQLGFTTMVKTYGGQAREVYVSEIYNLEIRIGKQELVPAFVDNEAHFTAEEGNPYSLVGKPHGHGDVHSLMYSTGTAADWKALGFTNVLFFQDTNAPVINAILPGLGATIKNGLDINFLTTVRELGEAMGMIMKVTMPDGRVVTRNVEYSYVKQGVFPDTANPAGKSAYPGNMNVIINNLDKYVSMLEVNKGVMPELINPKYADDAKTKFKAPTRPETNMQDESWSRGAEDFRVGATNIDDKRFWFAPTKNDDQSGLGEISGGKNPDTMDYTESAWYRNFRVMLAHAGVTIQTEPSQPTNLGLLVDYDPANVNAFVENLPAVEWDRAFAATTSDVAGKFKNVEVTNGSALSILGEQVAFEDVKLAGSLIITVPSGSSLTIKGVTVQNNGHQFVKLSADELVDPSVPEALRSRHYKVVNEEQALVLDLTNMPAGNYIYDASGLHRSESRDAQQRKIQELMNLPDDQLIVLVVDADFAETYPAVLNFLNSGRKKNIFVLNGLDFARTQLIDPLRTPARAIFYPEDQLAQSGIVLPPSGFIDPFSVEGEVRESQIADLKAKLADFAAKTGHIAADVKRFDDNKFPADLEKKIKVKVDGVEYTVYANFHPESVTFTDKEGNEQIVMLYNAAPFEVSGAKQWDGNAAVISDEVTNARFGDLTVKIHQALLSQAAGVIALHNPAQSSFSTALEGVPANKLVTLDSADPEQLDLALQPETFQVSAAPREAAAAVTTQIVTPEAPKPVSERIAVIGTGFVGVTKSVLMATDWGHDVIGVDVVAEKVSTLNSGRMTNYIPGLEPLLNEALTSGRLKFTTDYAEALKDRRFIFLALPTPQSDTGEANVSFLAAAVRQIAELMEAGDEKIVVTKSTAPPALQRQLREVARNVLSSRDLAGRAFIHFASEPEFLREGKEIEDDRVLAGRRIIAADNPDIVDAIAGLYNPINRNPNYFIADLPIFKMRLSSGPLGKYAANGYRALKISWINYIGWLADALGLEIDRIVAELSKDPRIGKHFLDCGVGFGGSCFPKDLAAAVRIFSDANVPYDLLLDSLAVNELQWRSFTDRIVEGLDGVKDKNILILGGAFKPGTDDVREARSILIIRQLLSLGANVTVYDPKAYETLKAALANDPAVRLLQRADEMEQALVKTDAVVLVTEWPEFKGIDFNQLKTDRNGRSLEIFDGRNLWDAAKMPREFGYHAIGRNTDRRDTIINEEQFINNARELFLAMRISYINRLAQVADASDANIHDIIEGLGLDPVVGSDYLRPSIGYGGYHLPRAVKEMEELAIRNLGDEVAAYRNIRSGLLQRFNIAVDPTVEQNRAPFTTAIRETNNDQIGLYVEKVNSVLSGRLRGSVVTVLGLSFKPNTYSTQNSPAIPFIQKLRESGARVIASDVDSQAIQNALRLLNPTHVPITDKDPLQFEASAANAIARGDVTVIVTPHPEYDIELFANAPAENRKVIDATHSFNPIEMGERGIQYSTIGINTVFPAVRSENRNPFISTIRQSPVPTATLRDLIASGSIGAPASPAEAYTDEFGLLVQAAGLLADVFGDDRPGIINVDALLSSASLDDTSAFIAQIFTPSDNQSNGQNVIGALVRQILGNDVFEALSRQGDAPIHTIAPISAPVTELPPSLLVELAFARPDDRITLVMNISEAEAAKLQGQFIKNAKNLGLPEFVASILSVRGIDAKDLAEGTKQIAAEDRKNVVGIMHSDLGFLDDNFTGLKRPGVAGDAQYAYRLLSANVDPKAAFLVAGIALRKQLSNNYLVRLAQIQSQYVGTNVAARMDQLIRAIQHIAVQA